MSVIVFYFDTLPKAHVSILLNNLPKEYKPEVFSPRTGRFYSLVMPSEDGNSQCMYISIHESKDIGQRFTTSGFETQWISACQCVVLPSLEDGNLVGLCEGAIATWWELISRHLKYNCSFNPTLVMSQPFIHGLQKISIEFPIFSAFDNNCYKMAYRLLQKGGFDLFSSLQFRISPLSQKLLLNECKKMRTEIIKELAPTVLKETIYHMPTDHLGRKPIPLNKSFPPQTCLPEVSLSSYLQPWEV
jgi:hypothetical protein